MKKFFLALLVLPSVACSLTTRSTIPRIPQNESDLPPTLSVSEKIEGAPIELTRECTEHIKTLQGMPGMKYGWAKSTEFPDPNTAPVYTFYYHYPTRNVPVAFFNGGPLADSHSSFALFWPFIQQNGTWMVFMDQRGTGCSSPLPEKTQERAAEYMHWGSAGVARDAEAVREALQVKRWYIFGQSFGAHIVERYLHMFPQSILTAVAHGGALLNDTTDTSQLRYEQQIYVIKKYLEKFPGDLDLVKKIVNQHLCNPISPEACGTYAVALIAREFLGFKYAWDYMHIRLVKTATSTISRPPWKNTQKPNELFGMSSVTYNAHGWVTHPDITNSALNCYKVRTLVLREIGRAEAMALSECASMPGYQGQKPTKKDIEYLQNFFSYWRLPIRTNEAIRENLEKYPDLNFYLFSSELDYYTPPAIISRAAGEIGPRVHYKKLMGAGHEAFNSEPVLRKAIPGLDELYKAYGQ